MKSIYRPIGQYIQLVDFRNRDLAVTRLLGLSIDKCFIPSVANTVGANMANYKIIKKGQFACSLMQVRRDKKMPVALLEEYDEAIISQAYPVFEVRNEEELLPEYLFMWMSRSEFDRHACFLAVGGVRGSLEWEDLCAMELPVPDIDVQREIVRKYNVVVDRIKLNEQLCSKLEETAQALYKHWFVEFEFPMSTKHASSIGKPDLNGKPYKSNGGQMKYCENINDMIPFDWSGELLGSEINYKKGYAFKSSLYQQSGRPIVRVSNFTKDSIDMTNVNFIDQDSANEFSSFSLKTNDVIISTVGSWPNNPNSIVGKVVCVPSSADGALLNQNAVRLRASNPSLQIFLYFSLANKNFSSHVIMGAQGSANQASVTLEHLFSYTIAKPEADYIPIVSSVFDKIFAHKNFLQLENDKLQRMARILLVSLSNRRYLH